MTGAEYNMLSRLWQAALPSSTLLRIESLLWIIKNWMNGRLTGTGEQTMRRRLHIDIGLSLCAPCGISSVIIMMHRWLNCVSFKLCTLLFFEDGMNYKMSYVIFIKMTNQNWSPCMTLYSSSTNRCWLATFIGCTWLGCPSLFEFVWSVWSLILPEDGELAISAISIGVCCGDHHLPFGARLLLGSSSCWRSS